MCRVVSRTRTETPRGPGPAGFSRLRVRVAVTSSGPTPRPAASSSTCRTRSWPGARRAAGGAGRGEAAGHAPGDRRPAMTVTTRRTRHALARHEDHDLLSPDAALVAALEVAAPGTVAARASDRLGFAHDASHYLLVPQAVVTPPDAAQVAALLPVSAAPGMPLTLRSRGAQPPGPAP